MSEMHHEHDQDAIAEHLDHCWDYIRQVIMCFGDPALEPAKVDGDGVRRNVDGWGATHQCRDWDALHDFAVNNRPDDSEGIGGL